MDTVREVIADAAPELLSDFSLQPTEIQKEALDALDFYRRAKHWRKAVIEDERGRTRRKTEYEYSTGCEVHFDAQVEEILGRQDAEALGVGKVELTDAYYEVAEKLGRKPTRADIDEIGAYRSAPYAQVFGSWPRFIRDIGEYTEATLSARNLSRAPASNPLVFWPSESLRNSI